MSTESLSGGQPSRQERYGSARTPGYHTGTAAEGGGESRNGAAPPALDNAGRLDGAGRLDPAGTDKPRLPSLDPAAPPEPVFADGSWLETDTETTSLADHPLLRGLLLELPPKGSTPPPDWLDRWFEATRSILELLYVR